MHGLEVHIALVNYQRRLWDSELSLVTIVKFTINRVILIVNLYLIVKMFTSGLIGSSPPSFSFGMMCFIRFLRSSYHVSFNFPHLHDYDDYVFNLKLA